MQAVFCSLDELIQLSGRPTVGDLMTLCEENYRLLARLAPDLKDQRGLSVSRRKGSVDLYLTIEEQSRYTSLARLTHWFPNPDRGWSAASSYAQASDLAGFGADPDARLRVYHDARQVEVLDLRQTVLPLRAQYQPPALDAKWKANLFLGKWLAFCLHQGHCFGPGFDDLSLPEDGGRLYTLT
ncbi:MAG: DUF1249 domain-containing protein [Lamprocystis purpurea]|jgi:hypothetical protein|uniref:DUF1249 domain-containing protein n=1 Tax=Lamprocystis purpurea TaxID=61598 RepID=UPI00035CE703|nr:DUF1249 domain-containing protein [Lamprocystis purpurea]MBV5272689.1 DUF1249 domain-containing protein [Lamprocystis purpurea]